MVLLNILGSNKDKLEEVAVERMEKGVKNLYEERIRCEDQWVSLPWNFLWISLMVSCGVALGPT